MRRFWIGLPLAALALWANNSALLVPGIAAQSPRLIAHRGVHQIYAGTDRSADTCRAAQVHPIAHPFLENTLPSMRAAFSYGADVVELDVHLTQDKVFAVFHDWELDCQTDGTGVTHKQTFAQLQALDIGYGITSDGLNFPLRGQDPMPSLQDVLEADLPGQILINFKSNRASEGRHLAMRLQDPSHADRIFGAYGGGPPTRAAQAELPWLKGFDRAALKSCWIAYAALSWSGYIPPACRNRIIAIPMNYAPYLWGWPHRLTRRLERAGTQVILWGPYDGTGFSSGIDDVGTLAEVPKNFDGYIWTDRIERIGPQLRGD